MGARPRNRAPSSKLIVNGSAEHRLPTAAAALEAAYARGAMPLTDLLDARRTFRAVRLDAVQAGYEHRLAEILRG